MRKHLIYHLCPLAANDGWRQNLERLGRHVDAFDGERLIAVAYDEGCAPLEDVKVELIGCGINAELAPVVNDPILREVASFEHLLAIVQSWCAPDDAIFYAHSKGNSTKDGEQGARRWRNAMYDRLLGRPAWEHLATHRMVGACKMTWDPAERRMRRGKAWRCPFPATPGKRRPIDVPWRWLFAGTFFWFTPHVFQLDWRGAIERDRYGAEGWPGRLYREDEALSVYQPRPQETPWNPYDPSMYSEEFE